MTQPIGSSSRASNVSAVSVSDDVDAPAATTTGSLLPDPTGAALLDGDPGAQIEALVLASAKDDRDYSRTMRDKEEALAESAEASQLRAMQDHADDAYQAGLIGGATTAASGLFSVMGGDDAKKVAQFQGLGKLVEGGGKMVSATFQHDADQASVESTHEEQMAGRFHRAADDQRDNLKGARELADQALTFYKEYVSAKNEAQKAALFRA